eukprot:gene10000-biopygen19769
METGLHPGLHCPAYIEQRARGVQYSTVHSRDYITLELVLRDGIRPTTGLGALHLAGYHYLSPGRARLDSNSECETSCGVWGGARLEHGGGADSESCLTAEMRPSLGEGRGKLHSSSWCSGAVCVAGVVVVVVVVVVIVVVVVVVVV